MDIFKITAIGVTGALLAVMLKPYRKEFAVVVSIVTGLVVVSMVISYMGTVFDAFGSVLDKTGMNPGYFMLIMKVTGIAYAAQFAASLCRDAGESAVAVKIETAAKVSVMVLTLPVLKDFLETVAGILGGI